MKYSIYNKIVSIKENMSILYNSFSGTYILINNDLAQCIKNGDIKKLLSEHVALLEELKENGILIDDDVNEVEQVENLRLTRKFSNREYSLIINPTLNCNLNCWYCYEAHKATDYMGKDLMEKILKHVKVQHEISNYKFLSLSFFGGEPLLNKEIVVSIFSQTEKYCQNEGIQLNVGFTTNGTLMTKEFLTNFKDVKTRFQITLDGNKARHNAVRNYKGTDVGSYDKIIANMKMMASIMTNYKLIVRINFDGKTLAGISDILDDIDFLPRERTVISTHRVWQVNESAVDYRQLFDFIYKANERGFVVNYIPLGGLLAYCCYADNFSHAVINFDGNVFKCTARDFAPEHRDGYLNNEGQIIWSAPKVTERMSTRSPEICRKCTLYPSCLGICSQNLLESNGSEKCRISSSIDIDDAIRINFSQFLLIKKIQEKNGKKIV